MHSSATSAASSPSPSSSSSSCPPSSPRRCAPPPSFSPPSPSFPLHRSLSVKEGTRLLIVGDVHGCADELELLLEKASIGHSDTVVLTGDVVAKGPSTSRVLSLLATHQQQQRGPFGRWHTVLGNHDQLVLRCAAVQGRLTGHAFADDASLSVWCPSDFERGQPQHYDALYYAKQAGFAPCNSTMEHWRIAAAMSDAQLHDMIRWPTSIHITNLDALVVHAGLHTGLALQQQRANECMNMRNYDDKTCSVDYTLLTGDAWANSFSPSCVSPLSSNTTVHFGHDAARGFQRPSHHALGLDTGCCWGGALTAVSYDVSAALESTLDSATIISVPALRQYNVPGVRKLPGGMQRAPQPPPNSGTLLKDVRFNKAT